jgi:hypothetical protein
MREIPIKDCSCGSQPKMESKTISIGKGKFKESYFVKCPECGIGGKSFHYGTEDECKLDAASSWNDSFNEKVKRENTFMRNPDKRKSYLNRKYGKVKILQLGKKELEQKKQEIADLMEQKRKEDPFYDIKYIKK